jgi:hypothetical protein
MYKEKLFISFTINYTGVGSILLSMYNVLYYIYILHMYNRTVLFN